MRFVFTPPAERPPGCSPCPGRSRWRTWRDDRLVEIRQRGISRHVVRFVTDGGELFALEGDQERLARREYRLLRELAELNVPAVEVVGIVVDRGQDGDAVLVTRYLDVLDHLPRRVLQPARRLQPTDGLLDALVELLARLHLSGFFWGDCSLSNTLFRYDAGTLEAYLVDAETSEQHPTLTDGQRGLGRGAGDRARLRRAARPAGRRAAAGRRWIRSSQRASCGAGTSRCGTS